MIATITSIELKSPLHFFALSSMALGIVKQLKKTNYLDFKKRGIWTKHYTMTLWNSEKDLQLFSNSGSHLDSMKKSKKIAKEIRTITIDAEKLPNWEKAKKLLEKAQIITY